MKMEAGPSRLDKAYPRVIGHPVARPSLKETTICPNCRYTVKDEWSFCPRCGIKLAPLIQGN